MADSIDRKELLTRTSDYVTAYIKFADLKAATGIGFVCAVDGAVAKQWASLTGAASEVHFLAVAAVTLLGGGLAAASFVGLYHGIAALRPRTPSANRSFLSFPDIAAMTTPQYREAAVNGSDDQVLDAFVEHTRTLSVIATAKFRCVDAMIKWAGRALTAALLLALFYGVCCMFAEPS